MKIHPLIIATLLILASSLIAQNYIWPTNSGHYLSSSFGEYRSGHFHSGIDIKTNYSTGYPVFAVADGYIWRVRTSPFGYGKALYLKLDDGNYAVYGHLDEFNQAINAYVKAEQLINKRYQTDIHFQENEYRVSQGDTIAFTGETGTKHPHLHFEIRDKNNRPINPLNTNLKITDYTIPTIKAIAIVPLNPSSRINGQPACQIFPASYVHKNLFVVSDSIRVSGPVGIEIKTHDTVRGIPNFYNPYGIRLTVDDSLFFHVQYDSFDFAEAHFIRIDRDFQLHQNGQGNFHRLWYDGFAKNLRFYSPSPGDGQLRLDFGRRSFEIEVFDRYMNTSLLKFEVAAVAPFNPTLRHFSNSNGFLNILFDTGTTDSISARAFWVSREGTVLGSAGIDTSFIDSTGMLVQIAYTRNRPREILKLVLITPDKNQSRAFFFNPAPQTPINSPAPEITFIHNPHTFLCRSVYNQAPECSPGFYIQTLSDFIEWPVIAVNPVTYVSAAVPLALFDSIIAFEWRYNQAPENILRIPARFKVAAPGNNADFCSADSALAVSFPPNSVYDTLVTWIKRTAPDNSPRSRPMISDLYTIYPLEQPLRSDILLEMKFAAGLDDVEKIGLYLWDDDEWNFLDNQLNSEQTAIIAYTNELGGVALLKDTEPPVITGIFPGNGGRFRLRDITHISAYVKDSLSGIKDDTSISVSLDDRPLYVEYNAPKDHIRYKIPGGLAEGHHTLTITVTDRANNRITKSSTFTVF